VERTLDVLLLENRPGVGQTEQAALEAAGHRVHRCHDADDDGFPCKGMVGERHCPLDEPIDVALLVRRGVSPRPTPFEDGVRCATRHDVPIVEHGSDTLDPFSPWIVHRVGLGEGVVAQCAVAADRADEPLRRAVQDRIGPVLAAAGLRSDDVVCDVESVGHLLTVHIDVFTEVEPRLEQAIAVRVLDAVRDSRRTHGQVSVQVHAIGRPTR
jgi:hypothetical protein